MRIRSSLLLLGFAAVTGESVNGQSADPVTETLSGFEEAIRLEEQLSQEKLNQNRQIRILESEIETLRAELEQTRSRIEEIESQRTEARSRREQLVRQRGEEEEALARFEGLVEEILPTLETLESRLPPWIDADLPAEDAPPGEFLLLLKNRFAENRVIDSGRTEITDPGEDTGIQVDFVSFGFGGAFFSAPDGSFGGRFAFDGKAWSPEVISEFAPQIHRLLLQEQGLEEPDFISLPVAIGGSR